MSNITLKVTTITFDKEKSKKLNFYINGKISNTDKIDNILVSSDFSDNIAMFAISENMETVIENSNTPISAMREIKTYQKKLIDEPFEEVSTGFENSIKSTYDFIYGVEGDNEIEFSKNKLFTGIVLKDNKAKIITTNYNSCYYISNQLVNNCFSQEEVLNNDDSGNNEEEGEFSPSNGVMKSKTLTEIKDGDLFIIGTQNVNSKLSDEIMASLYNDQITGEELAWEVINEISSKDITDEMIIMVITVVNVKKVVAKPEKTSKFTGFFKSDSVDDEIKEEISAPKYEVEEIIDEKPIEENAAYNEFTSIKIQAPGRMKKRMNIYLKRIISIVVVILLLAGIGFGMFKLFTLIFDNNTIQVSEAPSITPVESIIVTPTPTPTPVETPTPEPTSTPIQELYRDYTVQEGDSMWKISTTFYGTADYIDDIVSYNENLTDANSIYVGQKIKIPFLNTAPTPSGPSD